MRQSENQPLRADLGKAGACATACRTPLRVKAGDYIGLTAVTWLPAFAVNLDAPGNSWLASRASAAAPRRRARRPKEFEKYYKRNDAQLQASTVKLYECSYETARLLYWARIVPDTPAPADVRCAYPSAGAGVLLAELLEALGGAAARRRRVVLLGVRRGERRRRPESGCAGACGCRVRGAARLVLGWVSSVVVSIAVRAGVRLVERRLGGGVELGHRLRLAVHRHHRRRLRRR